MQPYAHYGIADFVLDDFFQSWVLRPDPASDAFWTDFLAEHPHQRHAVAEARKLVQAVRVDWREVSPKQSEQSYLKFEAKLDALTAPPSRYLLPSWTRTAAAVALLVVSLAAGWYFYREGGRTVYRTRYGEIRTLTLPDQSIVTLNANSTLTLPANWDHTQQREVWLDGEAYFKVTKKPGGAQARFLVHTPALDVEVLGTQFNVRSRARQAQVVLREGKVKVNLTQSAEARSVLLKPGESVKVSPALHQPVKEQVNPARFEAWRSHKLMLDNTPVSEVARVLEETHGVRVTFEDPAVAEVVLNGTSLPTDDLDKLINTLQSTLSVRIVREEDRIVFQK